jgi:hypothetical protein
VFALITDSPDMATSCRGGPGHTEMPLSDRTRLKLSGVVAQWRSGVFQFVGGTGMACRLASDILQQLYGCRKDYCHIHTPTQWSRVLLEKLTSLCS